MAINGDICLVSTEKKVLLVTRKMASGTLFKFPDRRFNPPFPRDLLRSM